LENKDEKYSLRDVEILLQLKTWWASICVLPVANRVVVLIANNTKITPNQITLVSLLMRTLAGLAFVQGTRWFLTLGAFCYYLAYVLDCVDGPVARLTRTTSEFGRYLDHLSDLVGDMFILFGLAYGQDLLGRTRIKGRILPVGFGGVLHNLFIFYHYSFRDRQVPIENKLLPKSAQSNFG